MPPVIGNLIAIAIVILILYVCGKNVVIMLKGELTGKGCSGCSGSCSGSCSGCTSCSSHSSVEKKK